MTEAQKSDAGGRPRADAALGALGSHPLSIRLTAKIEAGLVDISRLRGDGLDRSALVRSLLAEAVEAELARLRKLQQRP